MQIEIKIDSACKEPKVIIVADRMSEEVNTVVAKLSAEVPQMLAGFKEDTLKILEQTDIFRIYANGGKVYAVTGEGEYTLRLRLYELEERLDKHSFVRISNSEIINLKKLRALTLVSPERYVFPYQVVR